MASLSEQIDRLSRNTRAIHSTAELIAKNHRSNAGAGPYTRAVLSAQLGDLIRDIDSSELALFTLQHPPQDERTAPPPELTRAAFSGATPLRRQGHNRQDTSKTRNVEPEIYAQAALKCIDKYQAIRPMKGSSTRVRNILARLNATRQEIVRFKDRLEDAPASDASIQIHIQKEESRIRDLQSMAIEIRQRKQQAVKDCNTRRIELAEKSERRTEIPTPASPQDQFWNTPMTSAKTLRFTENLLSVSEQADMEDISMLSFTEASPLAQRFVSDNGRSITKSTTEPTNSRDTIYADALSSDSLDLGDRIHQKITERDELKGPTNSQSFLSDAKIDTPPDVQLEGYTDKFWATMGDQILPGKSPINEERPSAKDTLIYLHTISSLIPLPAPSTTSSVSSTETTPTAQQILTAQLLFTLLSSPPDYAISMNRAKDLLNAKGAHWGSTVVAGQGTSRIIYGCVAKRLLKIDRGGGEQMVKFDV